MRAVPAWVLALLLLPGAAAEGALLLESAEPVEVEGRLEVAMPGSSLLLFDEAAAGVREVHGVTGTVTFWTWKDAYARPLPFGGVELRQQVSEAVPDSFRVSNATLRLVPGGGPFALVVRMDAGSEARVEGGLHARGLPRRVDHPVETAVSAPPAMRPPDDVEWAYDPGWSYAGNHLVGQRDGLSLPADGRVRFEGGLRLKAIYGRVEFVDAQGREVRRDLGVVPGSVPGVLETRRLVLDADAASADLPLSGRWGLMGPSARWTLDGRTTWRDATGRVSVDGTERRVEGATVETEGRVVLAPEAPRVEGGLDAARYEGGGDFVARVEGAAVAAPAAARPSIVPVASVSLAALAALALVAWKGVGAFFTRISPGDVLSHPRRRAIHEAVRARPGERLRDLQRSLDMAWGSFSFHLHVLVRSGHLALRKEGAYTLVLPAAVGSRAVLIPHPTTRAVYESLPADGSPVAFPDLRARLGFSRQRVNHHLHALEARGLVDVQRSPDGARGVSRRAL